MQNVYILQLDTATSVCSVAVSLNGNTLIHKSLDESNIHASHLTVLIQELMDMAGLGFKELSAVAISMGPGSYTGLRIGVSTAKGICFALDIPLLAINTLQMMSMGCQSTINSYYVIPMIDARRMEVYTAIFDEMGKEIQATQALIIDNQSFKNYLEEKQVYFIGNGVAKCKALLAHNNAHFLEENFNNAFQMSAFVYDKFKQSDFESLAYFEPYYLKDFVPTNPKKLF